jgi:hypothetical protein
VPRAGERHPRATTRPSGVERVRALARYSELVNRLSQHVQGLAVNGPFQDSPDRLGDEHLMQHARQFGQMPAKSRKDSVRRHAATIATRDC